MCSIHHDRCAARSLSISFRILRTLDLVLHRASLSSICLAVQVVVTVVSPVLINTTRARSPSAGLFSKAHVHTQQTLAPYHTTRHPRTHPSASTSPTTDAATATTVLFLTSAWALVLACVEILRCLVSAARESTANINMSGSAQISRRRESVRLKDASFRMSSEQIANGKRAALALDRPSRPTMVQLRRLQGQRKLPIRFLLRVLSLRLQR